MSECSKKVPIIALRGLTVLPGMQIHFDVNRQISIEAIEYAMENDQQVLLLTQRNPDTEEPEKEDLFSMGTIATVKQMIKLPGNVIRVLVTGMNRAKLDDIVKEEPFTK